MKNLMSFKDKSSFTSDIPASIVVFLVALPLCMGIAIASGVPPARGLITGIVGGIVVSAVSGSPLLVSGPAAGLAVIVAEIVQQYGLEMVGPILILAGSIQFLAGVFKLGQLFRAMSPAVIYGMLAGIGILIFASQFHVMLDDKPRTHGLDNLVAIPSAIHEAIYPTSGSVHHIAALLGLTTLIVIILWDKYKPRSLKLLPGALISVIVSTIIATVYKLPVSYVDVPANLLETIQLPRLGSLPGLFHAPILLDAIAIAFIASAESLLSAVAVDRLHTGPRTDFDRELAAQGFGNMICGLLGALPMTGVIARSSVNVEAGAKTRFSGMLHGVWLLLLVIAAPFLLRMIPTSSLAAILVFTGYKLIEVEHIRQLKKYGRMPLVIFFATLIGIVTTDLLTGVLIGIILTAMTLIYKISILNIQVVKHDNDQQIDIYLQGAATFVRLPQLAKTLEKVPPGSELHIHLDKLAYIDHSCLDLLSMWAKQQQQMGSTLDVQWDGLVDRNRKPFSVERSQF
ncbi:SulP family inorganic anion transporter [Nostoc sp. CENA67]|uniref:SulP family inorganic anion transporter n=1 Tax=Amazonocrinis nigriterrae CENA67 TaxID=2794033 RepID=A0A8J7HKZ5_9NOST|nr:SulP family inorganic anion transporter [Amazonocrinis nigriterrae]MBH8561117.1 SulP family inorganic anion transporter [Amazonocrinis nigriterrae CENA67]